MVEAFQFASTFPTTTMRQRSSGSFELLILSAYAPDALQRAWNHPKRMLDRAGIRAEVLGAFADPQLGQVRFEDRIHGIYIVNTSALVEINEKFHGWGRDHYYRDFWMFARRDGRWWLLRYDYEAQVAFDSP